MTNFEMLLETKDLDKMASLLDDFLYEFTMKNKLVNIANIKEYLQEKAN